MNTIEPPILMSRILTFVFAAALAIVVLLVVTLANLLPLSKTQVFILTTQPRENTEITVRSFFPSDANVEEFKENFVKEYVKVRNEIITNINVMQRKWGTGEGGMVHVWSSPEVFAAFMRTRMFLSTMASSAESSLECRVNFTDHPVRLLRRDQSRGIYTYEVRFKFLCTNNALQISNKDYTIRIGIQFSETIRWVNRLENPLGVFVSEYTVEGDRDPLDFVY